MTEPTEEQKKKARRTLLLLLGVFLAPVMVSWLLYLNADRLHLGTSNKGELITPARSLDAIALPLPLTGGTLPADFWHRRWTIVYISRTPCEVICVKALDTTRDVRLDLTTHTDDVQRLYLSAGAPAHPQELRAAQPDLTVADVSAAGGKALLKQFDLGSDQALDGRYIYLVDTHGYLMMRYAVDSDPHGIIKDLQHLLGGGEM